MGITGGAWSDWMASEKRQRIRIQFKPNSLRETGEGGHEAQSEREAEQRMGNGSLDGVLGKGFRGTGSKIIIGALSCQKLLDFRVKICRETWIQDAKKYGIEVVFLVGSENVKEATLKGDILYLPCPDDYNSLPQKTRGFCKWALENRNFEYLFKCDDDTYVAIDRLIKFPTNDQDYIGSDELWYASGGAGYFLSKKSAEIISRDLVNSGGIEDMLVGQYLRSSQTNLTKSNKFRGFGNSRPRTNNEYITCHGMAPERFYEIHEHLKSGSLLRYVTSGIQGRLGNRMFEVACAIGYAEKYKKHHPLFLRGELGWPEVFNRVPDGKLDPNPTWYGEDHPHKYKEIPCCDGDVAIGGYRQSEKYFEHAKNAVIKALGPDNRTVNELKSKFGNYLKDNAIGMHVRRGDYIQAKHFHFMPDKNYYLEAIVSIRKKTSDAPILCFSEDLNWCKENFKEIKNIIFVSGQYDYMDLYLMSMCSHNITSASTFSWWGAWLNQNKDKIIITPKQWLVGQFIWDIAPINWVKI